MRDQISAVSLKRETAPKRGAVQSMTITAAENGVSVECRYASANGENEWHPSLRETTVFTKPAQMAVYIKGKFFQGEADTATHEKAETKVEEKAEHGKK